MSLATWAAKALGIRHAGQQPLLVGHRARTRFDWAREVGTGIDASVVTAPIQWVQRAFPEGRLRIVRGAGEDRAEVPGHPLARLIARPNEAYGATHLLAATIFSWYTAGNAYWIKARNGNGRVGELWYAPHWTVRPKWPPDGSRFVSHYEYRPAGAHEPVRYEPDDIVHFRHGIDPRDNRLGLSPLHGAIREIFVDIESSNMVASLLRNMGVPGLVISPESGSRVEAEDVEAVKKWLRESFAGDRRGDPLVMGAATKVAQFGFDPRQMDLSVARDVAEERVCAAIGIPAAVVGFGAGLQTAKVGATMGELRALAWHNGVLPLMGAVADEITRSLLPDFAAAAGGGERRSRDREEECEFDVSEVPALAEERLKNAQGWDTMVRGGWAEVAEGRAAMGLDVDDSHRVFLRPFSAIEVPAAMSGGQVPGARTERGLDSHAIKQEARSGEAATGTKQRARPTPAQRGYIRALERMAPRLAEAMERRLVGFFGDLGRAAGEAARPLLAERLSPSPLAGEGGRRSRPGEGEKQTPEDELLVGLIVDQLELPLHATTFRRIYEAHYLQVATGVSAAAEALGLGAGLPDPVARAVIAAGGRRSGLVDLDDQSRRALFEALAEGRAAGEGADQLAARITGFVEGGPWASADTRARTIARTETKFAQNTSTLARAGHEGVERFIVFDGRLGPGRSDPAHIARDGMIVGADEAARMTAEEHPNGTLSLAPFLEETPDA